MGAQSLQPQSLEERLVYWSIIGTWGLWLIGALYLAGPVLGYTLVLVMIARWIGIMDPGPAEGRKVPIGVLIWFAGMLAAALALLIAHLDFELGTAQLIKSLIGWAKGWALLAVFPLVGAMMSIRHKIIVRATCLLGLQTLVLVPLFVVAGWLSLPATLYVSPLSILGGPGPEFFDVSLYAIDDTNGRLRWRFFAPWSTAAAMVACLSFILALQERSQGLRAAGMLAAVAVGIMSGSRLSLIAVPLVLAMVVALSNLSRPLMLLAGAFAVAVAILMFDGITIAYEDAKVAFDGARLASSRVRAALGEIAYHRWLSEAPIFGHGIIERGPRLLHYMPIGSHHTWYGILFVKGAVGFVALAIPMAVTFVELVAKAQADRVARAALGALIVIFLFTFSDNIEIVAYLIWPAMTMLGIAMRRRLRNPAIVLCASPGAITAAAK